MASKFSLQDRIQKTLEKSVLGDPMFWRHPLAEAVVSLLSRQESITFETLIARLEEGFPNNPAFLKGSETISGTIQRLVDLRSEVEAKLEEKTSS